jgi:Putative peptidoglycan binding domain
MVSRPGLPAARPPARDVRHRAARKRRLGSGRRTATVLSAVLAMILLLVGGCKDVGGGGGGGGNGGGGGGGTPSTLSSCPPMSQRNPNNDSACVLAMQKAFFMLGEALVVDGSFGSETTAAVRRFQRSKGLTVDGIAGSGTLRALESALPASKVFTITGGVFTCGDLFGTCTFYFDRRATRIIYRALDGPVGVNVACPLLKDLRARLVCGLLVNVGTVVVRNAAGTAVRDSGCLAVNLKLRPVHVYSDNGRYCRG